ncbi:hypothetical protein FRB95_005134 [Tulasnella sp. JGI-2019a]|nr:hypothetical protein FRB95_005134 [Tulasnella sp. JGI-2019a]
MPPSLRPPPLLARRSSPKPFNVGSSIGTYRPLHLVFVHGFRGDHTSFQRFPTDLHYKLDRRIPSLESHVYPTYKSRKPLQYAVERLMDWMRTLEPGLIILIGHSLGGFVVAEAALQWDTKDERSQVIGFIAMDVPYLGVHPHVIVSGIASLFPGEDNAQSEGTMNDTGKVHMVNTSDAGGDSNSPGLSSSAPSALEEVPDLTPGPTALQQTVHFFRKHYHDPWMATKEWLISHWEHGSMLLDPDGMRNRYQKMQAWKGGEWINFYTETVPGAKRGASQERSISYKAPVQHVPFPVAQPFVEEGGTPHLAAPSDSRPHLPGTSSSQLSVASMRFPEPEEPAPFTDFSSGWSNNQSNMSSPRALSPSVSDSVTNDTRSTASSSRPSSAFGQPTLSSMTSFPDHTPDDKMWPDPPSPTIPGRPSPGRVSTDDSSNTVGPLFPEPHPPMDAAQQKQHDKAIKSIHKDQLKAAKQADKDAQKAIKATKKAVEAEEKARAKASAKEEKDRSKAEKEAEKKLLDKMTPEEKRANGPPRRFIILPIKSFDRSRWERVPVAGVPSEVEAHCGIFFAEKNWEYDAFVHMVGDWVVNTCQARGKDVLAF